MQSDEITIKASEGTIKVGQNFKYRLILNLILKYKNDIKMKLNINVFLHEIVDEGYVTNLNEYKSIGTHWITFYVNDDNVT